MFVAVLISVLCVTAVLLNYCAFIQDALICHCTRDTQ